MSSDDATTGSRTAWTRAAFVHERHRVATAPVVGIACEGERMAAWIDGMFVTRATFRERLGAIGLTESEFLALLENASDLEKTDSAVSPEALEWTSFIAEALSGTHADEPLPELSTGDPTSSGGERLPLPFAGFLRPFLQTSAHHLGSGLEALCTHEPQALDLFAESGRTDLLQTLAERLLAHCTRTLVLELNVARVRGLLRGADGRERFHHFADTILADPIAAGELLREYVVLARLLSTTCERWVRTSLELAERVLADRELIAELGGRGSAGALTSIRSGLGDLHCEGRSVTVLVFDSGLRVVYKPKSLAVDVAFQALLRLFNSLGPRHPHRTLTVLDRGNYGWVEFVEPKGCADDAEVARFYWRQGSYLALLYLTLAVDFHSENLIACGEYPVLIDLEGLFHHKFPKGAPETAYELTLNALKDSVLATGMLPMRMFGKGDKGGVDLSGLGGAGGQEFPRPVPTVEGAFTDTMHVVGRRFTTRELVNQPRISGIPADPRVHVERIIEGFEESYILLADHKPEVAEALRTFADAEIRHLVRPTRRYGLFLQEGHHPDYLRDGLDRDQLLDKLWAEAEARPTLKRLVTAEVRDLELGDVPMFTARPAERALWDSRGHWIDDFFERDSLGVAMDRLSRMGPEQRREQVDLIRGTLVPPAGYARARPTSAERESATTPISGGPAPADCLEAAVAIAEHLAERAVLGSTDVNWVGVSIESVRDETWQLSPLNTTLYDGLSGMAIFFAYLGQATARADFMELSSRALSPVRQHIEFRDPPEYPTGIGAFTGRAGHLYAVQHVATLTGDRELLRSTLAGLEQIRAQIAGDTALDLLGGAAGCVAVLLGLHQQLREPELLEAARECGEHLLASTTEVDGTLGWRNFAEVPLTGFSHGAAGIVWPLLRLAEATGDPRYRAAARAGLDYERRFFVPELGNWTDLRTFKEPVPRPDGPSPVQWCHGAPGIALGRLLSMPMLDDPRIAEEARVALRTTAAFGFGSNHSLCHGDFGHLEAFTLARELTGDAEWEQTWNTQAARMVREVRQGAWRCGVARNIETPGVMLGLAGIGLGLLRLWSPREVPSVLCLEPPRLE